MQSQVGYLWWLWSSQLVFCRAEMGGRLPTFPASRGVEKTPHCRCHPCKFWAERGTGSLLLVNKTPQPLAGKFWKMLPQEAAEGRRTMQMGKFTLTEFIGSSDDPDAIPAVGISSAAGRAERAGQEHSAGTSTSRLRASTGGCRTSKIAFPYLP